MSVAMSRHKHYRVCGMQISSSIPFPELRALPKSKGAFHPDMEFEIGGDISLHDGGQVVMTSEEPDGSPWMICTKTTQGYRLHFTDIADFLVDPAGRRVSCVAPPDTPTETIRHLFLDQVIPPLLNLRGAEALHASAIATAHGACAFIGMSGQGKSTLASAFHVIGHPILCDDCLVLKDDPDSILVQPAYPGLRLWDDSRGEFFGNRRSTLPVSHYNHKRRVSTHASSAVNSDFLPLRRIYSLLRSEASGASMRPEIEPLSIRDALVELLSYTFRLDLSDRSMILRQMYVLERVAREIPVRRLHLPDDLGLLPEVRELILQDLGQD